MVTVLHTGSARSSCLLHLLAASLTRPALLASPSNVALGALSRFHFVFTWFPRSFPGYLESPSCSSWHSAFLCVLPSFLSPSYPPILLALQSAFSLAVFHHCMLILGCLFPRFLWVPSREGIYLLVPLTPVSTFPCQTCGFLPRAASASSSSHRPRTLFAEASFSLLVLRAIPSVLCLPSVTTFRFVAMSLGRCSSLRTAVLSSHSWSPRGSVISVTVSITPVPASVLVPPFPWLIARVPAHLITTLGRRSRNAYQLYIRTPPHVLSSVATVFKPR